MGDTETMNLDEWTRQPVTELAVSLADIPFSVRARSPEVIARLGRYPADRPARFLLEPTPGDLTDVQSAYDRSDPRHVDYTPFFLEFTAIHKLIVERLLEDQVLMMHGSALRMDGQGYLFSARSGTGKSTHARLWREAYGDRVQMINDDKPLIRLTDEGARVYGTPWNGKHHLGGNISAPLKAIFFLFRDQTNHAEPLGPTEAFPLLISHVYRPEDRLKAARTMEMIRLLLQKVRVFRLCCNTDQEAARVALACANVEQFP